MIGNRSLENVTESDCVPNLPLEEGAQAKVLRVLDGDSLVVSTYREGCDFPLKTSVRLRGVDAAEIHSTNIQEKQMGYVAKLRLEDIALGKIVTVSNVGIDKYGRALVDVSTDTVPSVSEYMLQNKDACKAYDGGTKKSWHFSTESLALAPPIPPPQKRQLSPKRRSN